ncbi:MAG: CoA transferase [Dehalococcoidia bacterium]|nr:CoA transferase [Dehalococcoidia bacterium]
METAAASRSAAGPEVLERLCEALDERWFERRQRFAKPLSTFAKQRRARRVGPALSSASGRWRSGEPLAAGVPRAPVLDYAGMSEHPQYWVNEYLVEIETPHLGRLRVPGAPVRMSATPPRVDSAGPIPGRTEDILLAAGYDLGDGIAAFGRVRRRGRRSRTHTGETAPVCGRQKVGVGRRGRHRETAIDSGTRRPGHCGTRRGRSHSPAPIQRRAMAGDRLTILAGVPRMSSIRTVSTSPGQIALDALDLKVGPTSRPSLQ